MVLENLFESKSRGPHDLLPVFLCFLIEDVFVLLSASIHLRVIAVKLAFMEIFESQLVPTNIIFYFKAVADIVHLDNLVIIPRSVLCALNDLFKVLKLLFVSLHRDIDQLLFLVQEVAYSGAEGL